MPGPSAWGAGAVAVLVVALTFWRTHAYALVGFDSYPILLTSRIRSWSDFLGSFTEKLMDGRYPEDFYRPLLNLSFAADHALWKLDPFGYQLTNALWFGACAWAVWLLASRAGFREQRYRIGGWLAMAVFTLHPLTVEVVPVPSRRPELMCGTFMTLALAWQLRPRGMRGRRGFALVAFASLLALLSKETALVLPLLGFAVGALRSDRPGVAARLAAAARGAAPHVAAVLVVIPLRVMVLGGFGGTGAAAAPRAIGKAATAMLGLLIVPQSSMRVVVLGLAVLAGLALLAIVLHGQGRFWWTAIALGAAWLLAMAVAYAGAGRIQAWYLLLPSIGWALVVAGAAQALGQAAHAASSPRRIAAVIGLLALGGLVVWQARFSPWVHDYRPWREASQASAEFLSELERRIDAEGDGTWIPAPLLPRWVRAPQDGRPTVLGAAILTDYSVQAWAELVRPERRIRVVFPDRDVPPPTPGELVVVFTGLREGFDGPNGTPSAP